MTGEFSRYDFGSSEPHARLLLGLWLLLGKLRVDSVRHSMQTGRSRSPDGVHVEVVGGEAGETRSAAASTGHSPSHLGSLFSSTCSALLQGFNGMAESAPPLRIALVGGGTPVSSALPPLSPTLTFVARFPRHCGTIHRYWHRQRSGRAAAPYSLLPCQLLTPRKPCRRARALKSSCAFSSRR